MCINENVSLVAFTVCSLSCLYLFKRNNKNDRWIAILFGFAGSMQFLEYLMWKDQECKGLNQTATDLALLNVLLQPFLSLALAYYFTGGKLPSYIYIAFIIYLLTNFPKYIKNKKKNDCSKPCNKDNIGLSWKFTADNDMFAIPFLLALIFPFLSMKDNGIKYAGSITGTFILAHFISEARCPGNKESPPNGSWWCIMSTVIPLLAIKINK